MWMLETGFKFWMSLRCKIKWMILDFNKFDQMPIRRSSPKYKTMLKQNVMIVRINLISMPMPFSDMKWSIFTDSLIL